MGDVTSNPLPFNSLTLQLFNVSDSQRERRIGFDLSGEAVGHVGQEKHPKRKRQPEQWKLEDQRQRIDDSHEWDPDRPSREQRRQNFVSIMGRREQLP